MCDSQFDPERQNKTILGMETSQGTYIQCTFKLLGIEDTYFSALPAREGYSYELHICC